VQLLNRQLNRLVVADKLKMKSIAVYGNSQTRRAGAQTQHRTQLILGKFVEPAMNPQEHLPTLLAYQS
jgi:hypothetical protein